MDEPTLKTLIHNLEAQRGHLDSWLHSWTALVAAGVLLEIIFLIRDHWERRKAWKLGITKPEKPPLMWLFVEIGVTALIAGGLAGELGVSVKAERLETKIRESNARLILLLEQKLTGVEKRQYGRTIDKAKFIHALEGKPKRTVELRYVSDFDAYMFSGYILEYLGHGARGDGAGWDVSAPAVAAPNKNGEPYQTGITIVAKAVSSDLKPEDKDAMEALEVAFLRSSGPPTFFVSPRQDPTLPDGTFRLIVGQKQ